MIPACMCVVGWLGRLRRLPAGDENTLVFPFPAQPQDLLFLSQTSTFILMEAVGTVLGVIPLILSAVENYRELYDQFEEYRNFDDTFSRFIESIQRQQARYQENLQRLLDPIISDPDDVDALINDLSLTDQRWHDGSLDGALKQRLATRHGSFFRVIGRIQTVLADLERMLQIKDGKVKSMLLLCTSSKPLPLPPAEHFAI